MSNNKLKEKRITVLHFSTQKEFRGGERQIYYLHCQLLENNIKSIFISPKFKNLDGNMIHNKVDISPNINALVPLFLLIKKHEKDSKVVVHAHDSRALTYLSLLNIVKKIKIIYTKKTVYKIKDNFFNRLKFGNIVAICAVSQKSADIVRKFENGKYDSKIHIINDGIDFCKGCYKRDLLKKQFDIPEGKKIIGTVGYFTSEKNPALIIKLAYELKRRNSDSIIVTIGKFYNNELINNELYGILYHLGELEQAEKYYSLFDIYISTSKKEGLGSALLDAIYSDIPVVALNSGGAEEIFGVGASQLIDGANEDGFIKKVIHDLENIEEATIEALRLKKRLENRFSIEKMAEKYIELYLKL